MSSIINGFVPTKIQSIVIKDTDCKKFGIKSTDFAKVDKSGDGLITADEFLATGMNYTSIHSAFKSLAQKQDGYLDGENLKLAEQNPKAFFENPKNPAIAANNMQANKRNNTSTVPNSLTHPQNTNPALGQKYDYIA